MSKSKMDQESLEAKREYNIRLREERYVKRQREEAELRKQRKREQEEAERREGWV